VCRSPDYRPACRSKRLRCGQSQGFNRAVAVPAAGLLGYCSAVPRRELIDRVLTGLPASSDSVAYPDHPLLLRGPDILASINSRLTAYFILDEHVRRLPVKFLSNVVLSRLALPAGTNFVLILGNEAIIRDVDSNIFEEVTPVSNDELAKFPAGRMRESQGGEIMESLRRPHNERFGRAWSPASEQTERRRRVVDRPTSIRGFDSGIPRARVSYMDFHEGRFILDSPSPERRISTRDLLERASNAAVQVDYWLDLGVPGVEEVANIMRSRDAYLALHESRIPFPGEARRFDALKPFRAAAFAGFAVGRVEDSDDI